MEFECAGQTLVVCVKTGFFKNSQSFLGGDAAELAEALQSLPDRYLGHLPKLESVAFNYSAYIA